MSRAAGFRWQAMAEANNQREQEIAQAFQAADEYLAALAEEQYGLKRRRKAPKAEPELRDPLPPDDSLLAFQQLERRHRRRQ